MYNKWYCFDSPNTGLWTCRWDVLSTILSLDHIIFLSIQKQYEHYQEIKESSYELYTLPFEYISKISMDWKFENCFEPSLPGKCVVIQE